MLAECRLIIHEKFSESLPGFDYYSVPQKIPKISDQVLKISQEFLREKIIGIPQGFAFLQ